MPTRHDLKQRANILIYMKKMLGSYFASISWIHRRWVYRKRRLAWVRALVPCSRLTLPLTGRAYPGPVKRLVMTSYHRIYQRSSRRRMSACQ
jgi:hypothetical protein